MERPLAPPMKKAGPDARAGPFAESLGAAQVWQVLPLMVTLSPLPLSEMPPPT
jgi:hypothetical protein